MKKETPSRRPVLSTLNPFTKEMLLRHDRTEAEERFAIIVLGCSRNLSLSAKFIVGVLSRTSMVKLVALTFIFPDTELLSKWTALLVVYRPLETMTSFSVITFILI